MTFNTKLFKVWSINQCHDWSVCWQLQSMQDLGAQELRSWTQQILSNVNDDIDSTSMIIVEQVFKLTTVTKLFLSLNKKLSSMIIVDQHFFKLTTVTKLFSSLNKKLSSTLNNNFQTHTRYKTFVNVEQQVVIIVEHWVVNWAMHSMAMFAIVLELVTWVSLDTQSVSDVTNKVRYPFLGSTDPAMPDWGSKKMAHFEGI